MNTAKWTLTCATALLLAGCAGLPAGSIPGAPRAGGHPGFDTSRYPGEAALSAWRRASPYRWVGYYLVAPCHRDASWVGARPTLERLGWGVAILYVGQQAFQGDTSTAPAGRPIICSRTLLTAQRGREDGLDAIRRAEQEGFARGSIVYLDVERMQGMPPEMLEYYRAWTETLLRDGRYEPGTYAHRDNATALYAVARAAFAQAGRSGSPAFWVAGGSGFSLDQPPYAVGLPFATVWQGVVDVDRSWGGVTLRVDENVASRPSPSAPPVP